MSNNVKTLKRGEFLFKEGDKITNLVLIQSGAATMCVARPKKNIDMFPVAPSQIAGEMGLIGATTHSFSLMATSEVKYMEVPIETVRTQLEALPQFIRIIIKSLADRLKLTMSEVKTNKMERDASPCPEDQVAKIFGAIYHCGRHKAKPEDEKKPNIVSMDWTQFKQYCQRVFGESPRRTEQACTLLVKLKMATFEMGKPIDDPEGPDEIQTIHFSDLGAIEAFFEFYQYYYFKGGASAILKYDENCANLLSGFLKVGEGLPLDRFGAVALEFPKVIDYFKNEMGITLNAGHFTQLEGKGLFAKRQTRSADNTVILSFEYKEWATNAKIWRMLREIEKWNERGFVDLQEEEPKFKKKVASGPTCAACNAEVTATAKFCPECGAKIEAKAAA